MKVINLFGGPGTGKSTTAAGLFNLMKIQGYSVELVTEYAKDLVWGERGQAFSDPLYMLAKQNHRLHVLQGKVDYIITDSPLLLSNIYTKEGYHSYFASFVDELYTSYDNINLFLNRVKPYVEAGRNETEKESDAVARKIYKLLAGQYAYRVFDADEGAPKRILEILDVS